MEKKKDSRQKETLIKVLKYIKPYGGLMTKINQYVGGDNLIIRAGYLRNMPVSIGGTTWKPDMPIESQIKEIGRASCREKV